MSTNLERDQMRTKIAAELARLGCGGSEAAQNNVPPLQPVAAAAGDVPQDTLGAKLMAAAMRSRSKAADARLRRNVRHEKKKIQALLRAEDTVVGADTGAQAVFEQVVARKLEAKLDHARGPAPRPPHQQRPRSPRSSSSTSAGPPAGRPAWPVYATPLHTIQPRIKMTIGDLDAAGAPPKLMSKLPHRPPRTHPFPPDPAATLTGRLPNRAGNMQWHLVEKLAQNRSIACPDQPDPKGIAQLTKQQFVSPLTLVRLPAPPFRTATADRPRGRPAILQTGNESLTFALPPLQDGGCVPHRQVLDILCEFNNRRGPCPSAVDGSSLSECSGTRLQRSDGGEDQMRSSMELHTQSSPSSASAASSASSSGDSEMYSRDDSFESESDSSSDDALPEDAAVVGGGALLLDSNQLSTQANTALRAAVAAERLWHQTRGYEEQVRERETLPFLALPLPLCQSLTPLLVVLAADRGHPMVHGGGRLDGTAQGLQRHPPGDPNRATQEA